MEKVFFNQFPEEAGVITREVQLICVEVANDDLGRIIMHVGGELLYEVRALDEWSVRRSVDNAREDGYTSARSDFTEEVFRMTRFTNPGGGRGAQSGGRKGFMYIQGNASTGGIPVVTKKIVSIEGDQGIFNDWTELSLGDANDMEWWVSG